MTCGSTTEGISLLFTCDCYFQPTNTGSSLRYYEPPAALFETLKKKNVKEVTVYLAVNHLER